MQHRVKQGECLISIAAEYGFADWQTIYFCPENAEFRKLRPNPHTLYAGDVVQIPTRKSKMQSCPTGVSHEFRVQAPQSWLRIQVCDEQGNPLKGHAYRLRIENDIRRGKTTGDGIVEQRVPMSATTGELTVYLDKAGEKGARFHWQLQIGTLDPATQPSGIRARLDNLGFSCTQKRDPDSVVSAVALRSFQHSQALPESGVADEATRQKLVLLHGQT